MIIKLIAFLLVGLLSLHIFSVLSSEHLPIFLFGSPNMHDLIVIASSDGKVHFVESDTWKFRWSFSSCPGVCSSCQIVGCRKNDTKSLANGDFSIECGDDWNFCVLKRKLGKVEPIGTVDMVFLHVPQPSSSSTLSMSHNQPRKGANACIIGFLVLSSFIIIVGLLRYRWRKNRVQPNRQPVELDKQRKGKNKKNGRTSQGHIKVREECSPELSLERDANNKNTGSTSRGKNKNKGNKSQGHCRNMTNMHILPKFLLERDSEDKNSGITSEGNVNNGSPSQGHIKLEDKEECTLELLCESKGIFLPALDNVKKGKMVIEELFLERDIAPREHIHHENEKGQIEKLLLKGNVTRPPIKLMEDYQQGDGHFIGKLFVSKRKIARGSHGTIIFEGMYNEVHVAIKRVVRCHNFVLLNEIRRLIKLVQHPNIVHVIDIGVDDRFAYFALERCTCNLYEFIQLCSNNFDQDDAQDRSIKRVVKTLWQPNGYPSAVLVNLIRDVVTGLAHLHDVGYTGRDLKPQNVLISYEKSLCAKICDQGIIEGRGKFVFDKRSPGWHATRPIIHKIPSYDWMNLLLDEKRREVDLFNLGCIIFFFITKGRHPFGPVRKRSANIKKNCPDLSLVKHIYEAEHLISKLLHPKPHMRPEAIDVLRHPFFWDSEKRGLFLQDVIVWFERDDIKKNDFIDAMMDAELKVLVGNWDVKMEALFLAFATSHKCYNYGSVLDLLRLIGNTLSHQKGLPDFIQVLIGSTHGEIYDYFASRFPNLLIEVYDAVSLTGDDGIELILAKYYWKETCPVALAVMSSNW